MKPSVYLYNETVNGFELYIGECSTLEGLSLFDVNTELEITNFGATGYKRHGWATEAELPDFDNVGSMISFLESEGDIGIIDFSARLSQIGTFSTHDDSECHFIVESKQRCIAILKTVIQPKYCNMLIYKLLSNQGLYLTCSPTGNVTKYSSFDEYLAKKA